MTPGDQPELWQATGDHPGPTGSDTEVAIYGDYQEMAVATVDVDCPGVRTVPRRPNPITVWISAG